MRFSYLNLGTYCSSVEVFPNVLCIILKFVRKYFRETNWNKSHRKILFVKLKLLSRNKLRANFMNLNNENILRYRDLRKKHEYWTLTSAPFLTKIPWNKIIWWKIVVSRLHSVVISETQCGKTRNSLPCKNLSVKSIYSKVL